MQKVRKGVIAVAGRGTRFLPATKSMPKEMLPIIDKPIVQYIVEEMVASGIETIVFVTSLDKRALEDHFDHASELESYLKDQGKMDRLEQIQGIAGLANFVYVRQKGPYGNGTPLLNVREIIGDEPFIYAFGDDLVKSDVPFTKQLIDIHNEKGGCVLGAQEVPREEIHKYGCYAVDAQNTVTNIVEKPKTEEAPSNLAGVGRYLLTPEIFDALEQQTLGKDNELWLMDAVQQLVAQGKPVSARAVAGGQWLTTGDPLNYLKATIEYLKDRPELAGPMREYLSSSNFLDA